MSSTTTERELDPFSGAIPRTDITIATTAGRGDRAQSIRVSRRRSPSGQWRIALIGTETRLLGYWREIQIADPAT
jgi:hypothetical protein